MSHYRFRLPKTHAEHGMDSHPDTQTSAACVHQLNSCIYTNITHITWGCADQKGCRPPHCAAMGTSLPHGTQCPAERRNKSCSNQGTSPSKLPKHFPKAQSSQHISQHNHSSKSSEEAAWDSSDMKQYWRFDSWKCHPIWFQGVPTENLTGLDS